ncbi:MAG TPA: hypothetical protein VEU94_18505, partial [Terriglobales bacterium]|nr:hypothetical protein [Terriglobales bacterium]
EGNREADDLANQAMDKGTGRGERGSAVVPITSQEFEGVVRDGAVKLTNGVLPDGTRVQVRVKK